MCLWIFLPARGEDTGSPDQDRLPLPFTFNSTYPRTYSAILKVVQVVFSLVAFICAMAAPWWTTKSLQGFQFFTAICQLCIWAVVIMYLLIVLNIHHHCRGWAIGEFITYVVATLLLLIASITAAALTMNSAMTASAVFGFFTTIWFAVGVYVSYKEWRTLPSALPASV